MGAAMVARMLLLTLLYSVAAAFPEQGRYFNASSELKLEDKEKYSSYGFEKTMYKDTTVTAQVVCTSSSPASLRGQLYLLHSSCYNEKFVECSWSCLLSKAAQPGPARPARDSEPPNTAAAAPAAAAVTTQGPAEERCCYRDVDGDASKYPDEPRLAASVSFTVNCTQNGKESVAVGGRRRREDPANTSKANPTAASSDVTTATADSLLPGQTRVKAPKDGVYFVLLRAECNTDSKKEDIGCFSVDLVEAKSSYGYLSAVDWPNYYFYMILVIVYIFFQIAWLVMLACNWRDLLRVQYYIGAVILLGMIEKAVLFAEYENINKSGISIKGAVIFAQIVSCLKRALSRVLIIIVCLGYGIVKPRLGPTLQKVLAAGIVYFVVAAIEGCIRITRDDYDATGDLIAAVALVVVEVGVCWWIFASLVQTYRTLRLRRNLVKLAVYRHFANALIFSVLASLAFMGWFLYAVRFATCISDLRELWLEEGFWQILFTILLLIVIILWRPSANNQRYAFAPLLDAGDEGEEDENYTVVMGETFTGTKQRPAQGSDGQKKGKDREYRAEDDLKWIEENIPTTALADKVLTVDSDEERAAARNEISKMD